MALGDVTHKHPIYTNLHKLMGKNVGDAVTVWLMECMRWFDRPRRSVFLGRN
jgi:hypothetical protein